MVPQVLDATLTIAPIEEAQRRMEIGALAFGERERCGHREGRFAGPGAAAQAGNMTKAR